jgi:splicing factor 3A subunit 1
MTTCTICGQQIAVDELDEHMRIELLDPKWKSQRDIVEGRKAQASELQRGANVVSSLKNLARSRVDIFGGEVDEERRKRQEEEEREKRKEREKVVWDGHTASKEGTLSKYQTNVNFDEQIAAIHRAKGLGPYVLSICLLFFMSDFSSLIAKRPTPLVQALDLLLLPPP